MLTNLSVKNFAIIEDIDISFRSGLTVLTGETGAGKSLIIDSIHLLIDERASTEMIRNGKDKAVITGTFTFKNARLSSLLDELDIPYDNNILVINRTIAQNKSTIKVNDKVVSLQELKSISKYLADIHQQFDMIKLLNKDNYLEIIDGFKYELVKEYHDKYLSSLSLLKDKQKEYDAIVSRIQEIKERRDIYEYEYNELKSFNLSLNEEEENEQRIELLKNFDKIYALMEEIKSLTDKDSLSDLYQIKKNLEKLSSYQNEYQEIYEKVNDYHLELEEIYADLVKKFNRLDYDPQELEDLENRQSEIGILKKKYHKEVPELIAYLQELEILLKSDEDLDTELNNKKVELASIYDETYQYALDMSKIRNEIARIIEKELIANLNDVALKSDFQIVINTAKKDNSLSLDIFKETGIDDVDFLIETNIGEGLKPLAKVVSGGEMSRIMLAIKALFIKSQKISTVIFDEVDTGISGEIARKVALKIRDISLSTQVISITHLPQVASLSNNHIKISKQVKDGRTYTSIKELNLEEKIYEVASMISGGKVTDSQLAYAKEMILAKE